MNELVKVATEELQTGEEISYAILININVISHITSDFLMKVKEAFVNQRMISPVNTSLLLITLIGNLNARDFASPMKKILMEDEITKNFMQNMNAADVIQGSKDGKVLSSASLL